MKRSLYVMQDADNGHVKVGISKTPDIRRGHIAWSDGRRVSLLYVSTPVDEPLLAERTAHSELREGHVTGEWFSASPAYAIEVVERVVRMRRVQQGEIDASLLLPEIIAKFGDERAVLDFLVEERPEIVQFLMRPEILGVLEGLAEKRKVTNVENSFS